MSPDDDQWAPELQENEYMPNKLPWDVLPCTGTPLYAEQRCLLIYHGTDHGDQYGRDGKIFWAVIICTHITQGRFSPSFFSYPDNLFNSLSYHTDSSSISTDQDTCYYPHLSSL